MHSYENKSGQDRYRTREIQTGCCYQINQSIVMVNATVVKYKNRLFIGIRIHIRQLCEFCSVSENSTSNSNIPLHQQQIQKIQESRKRPSPHAQPYIHQGSTLPEWSTDHLVRKHPSESLIHLLTTSLEAVHMIAHPC